jgi:hypothetical protein
LHAILPIVQKSDHQIGGNPGQKDCKTGRQPKRFHGITFEIFHTLLGFRSFQVRAIARLVGFRWIALQISPAK